MARSFNGSSDLINCGTSSILNPNGGSASMTASIWAYATSFPNAYNAVMGRSDGVNHYYVLQPKSTGKLALYYIDNLGAGQSYDGTGSNTLSTGIWYHLAFTIGSGGGTSGANGCQGFVNGAIDGGNSTATGGITTISASTCLGSDNHGANWAGRLADAAIWNVILTPIEIAALAKGIRPKSIRRTALLGYWPVDGLQSPEPDLSGNVNNGTLTGTSAAFGPPIVPFTPRWPRYELFTPPVPPQFVLMPQIVM